MLKLGELNELEASVVLIKAGLASSIEEARKLGDVVVVNEAYVPPAKGVDVEAPFGVFGCAIEANLLAYHIVHAFGFYFAVSIIEHWTHWVAGPRIRYVISPSYGSIEADRAFVRARRLMQWAEDAGEAHPEAIGVLREELKALLEEITSQIPEPLSFIERERIRDDLFEALSL